MAITTDDLIALADAFDWSAWRDRLRAALEPRYRAVAEEQASVEAVALDLAWTVDDPFLEPWFTGYLADRITQIDETTRRTIREVLQSAMADGVGESATALAARIREAVKDTYAFSPARALNIARTEMADALNAGALLLYRQNGITHVRVSDGDYDPACAAADGQIWTLAYALDHRLEHPGCVRSFRPVLTGRG